MKYTSKTSIPIGFLLILTLLMSACSQGYRQTTQHHSASQQATPPQQAEPVRNIHQTRRNIVLLANKTLGSRYRYGGANPKRGFDCSGLMVYVHNQAGVHIPRTAAKQRLQSRTITYAQLQPGDMLFFKTGKRTEHVGIYIGDRKFIHASTGSRKVKVASMDSAYWYKRFVKFGTFL